MIITVTANPSIDITMELDQFEIGEVNRAERVIKDPAGKGINVARALTRNGVVATAVFPADHSNGGWIIDALGKISVPTVAIPIAKEVRQNITIVDAAGKTTKINQAGPALNESETNDLLSRIAEVLAHQPKWLVAAGSLPGGLGDDFYVKLGELAQQAGVKFAVDSSGDALVKVAQAKNADLLKPNWEELEELAGRGLPTVGDVVEFARTLIAKPGAVVLVSLGEHGALAVSANDVSWAGHEPVVPLSTVGAGDCTLAGYLAANIRGDESLLTTAVAWGTAAVQLPGTTMPGPDDIIYEGVRTAHNLDFAMTIKELNS